MQENVITHIVTGVLIEVHRGWHGGGAAQEGFTKEVILR